MQVICSYVLWPLAVVMGVNVADCRKVAEMIGTKTFLNEFVAYSQLSQLIHNRETLERHVTDNGTWYWHDDDVILTSPGLNDTVLTNGVITVLLHFMFRIQGSPKIGTIKLASFLYALTSSNINRFSKFFHCQNLEKICNNIITKDSTTPQVCCYITL